jgi:hypothetical protein
MLFYAATIFLSAFLLFQVQPLIAKFVLPWFGGSAAVWSSVLLFFQLLLLVGYLYAHCLIKYLKARQQLWVHVTLLTASLATLPIIPSARWKPAGGDDPTLGILLLLGATVGLPYTLLSATSPLLQAWYVRMNSAAIPYRLFALSNFGSLLALLSYPFVVEPRLALSRQAVFWSAGYAAFAVLCSVTGWKSREGKDLERSSANASIVPPTLSTQLLWIGLAACASTLLLAITSHLTQNVAPIPLLWIAPLSLYLLSFILCFESDRIYNRVIFLPLLLVSLGLIAHGDYLYENNEDVKRLVEELCAAFFVCCMVCHGELARRRPNPRYLTQFYLMVSVGGAIGGLFVALAAPRWFNSYLELPIGMVACAALVTCVLWNVKPGLPRPIWLRAAMVLVTLGFAGYLARGEVKKERGNVMSARNFYGTLKVRDDPATHDTPAERVLVHGTIDHGSQLLGPNTDRTPTSYFGRNSGVSLGLQALGQSGPLRIGVLGLGAGVTATLARAGDTLHYYEINPLVVQIANKEFGFFRACPADKQLFLGDARLVLDRLPDEHLDYLALDAFSSDAIPIHLLAREAYKIYDRHLNSGGILAVHISNRYLDLEPVVARTVSDLGWAGLTISDEGEAEPFYSASTWILVSRNARIFENPVLQRSGGTTLKPTPGFRPWTDDYSNVLQILK